MARVTYTNGVLKAYTNALPGKADRLAAKAALRVEGLAKERAPVDTGALRNSIQTQNAGTGKRVVLVGVEYAYFVEFGTWKMAAQPYFTPAVEQVAKELPAMAKAELAP